eukprot:2194331-Prymnesium_polylepis.1
MPRGTPARDANPRPHGRISGPRCGTHGRNGRPASTELLGPKAARSQPALAPRPLSLRWAMPRFWQALVFTHNLKLIHCDLKPENILIKSYSRCEVK